MKIALLTDGIWPFVVGGMQKHSYYLCKYLADRNVDVDLYHTSPQPEQVDIKNLFTEQELKHIRSFVIPFPKADSLPGHYLRASFGYSSEIKKALTKNGYPDIIYAKGLTSWSLLDKETKVQLKVPVCINVHGYEYFQKAAGWKQLLQQYMLRKPFSFVNRHADYIYSYGGGITKIIENNFTEQSQKIFEVPAGISSSFLVDYPKKSGTRRKMVFLGRFEKRKGIVELNRVLRRLKPLFQFEFAFIGDVPRHLQINSPDITYYGMIRSEQEIKTRLRESDVLICPSYSEGMPNVIMEAMASGCAVIATRVGAVDLLVDDTNGWIVKAGSVLELREAIEKALTISDSDLYEKKLKSIARIKENYLWDQVIDRQIASFQEILNRERSLRSHKMLMVD